MTTLETVRLIGEVLGILVFTGGGLTFLIKQSWRILDEQRSLTEQLIKLNGTVAAHTLHLAKIDQDVVLQNLEVSRLAGYVQGRQESETT